MVCRLQCGAAQLPGIHWLWRGLDPVAARPHRHKRCGRLLGVTAGRHREGWVLVLGRASRGKKRGGLVLVAGRDRCRCRRNRPLLLRPPAHKHTCKHAHKRSLPIVLQATQTPPEWLSWAAHTAGFSRGTLRGNTRMLSAALCCATR